MSAAFHLELESRIECLSELNAGIDTFSRDNELGKSAIFELRLVLEELIVNVINYAFDDPEKGHPIGVTFEMAKYGEAVAVTIEDGGRYFNPLEEISSDQPVADPGTVGGFGIFLVEQKTRDLSYKRVGGKTNRVTFWIDARKSA